MNHSIDDAVASKGEHDWVDFKREFDPGSAAAWCEIVRDVVAMANSGGGFIVIGLNDDGTPSGADIQATLLVDPAVVADKIRRYTGVQFASFSLHRRKRNTTDVQVVVVRAAQCPVVFTQAGNCTSYQTRSRGARSLWGRCTFGTEPRVSLGFQTTFGSSSSGKCRASAKNGLGTFAEWWKRQPDRWCPSRQRLPWKWCTMGRPFRHASSTRRTPLLFRGAALISLTPIDRRRPSSRSTVGSRQRPCQRL